jgi:PAS domain S-box-containing protein
MADPRTLQPCGHSFSRYILLWMIVLVLCVVGFLTVSDYLFTKSNFDREEVQLRILTEQNIHEAFEYKDTLWNIYDASLNERMQAGLVKVMEEYERSGRDPGKMDLAGTRDIIGSDFDIYVIDKDGVIVYTTYPQELGMDFRTIPSFFRYLTRIRSSDGFFPDRIVSELMGEGQFRKYAYMPTPDHDYVLELGLSGRYFKDLDPTIEMNDNIDAIVAVNPYVEGYRVFNTMGRRSDDNSLPEPAVQEVLAQVIRTRQTVEVADPALATRTRYLFIDLEDPMYGSDPSRIIEITYSDRLIDAALSDLLLFHLLTGAAAILIGCIIAFILSRRLTRPVREIAMDVDIISRGNLDHRIRLTDNREFSMLACGINTMVDSLKAAFTRMRDDEIFKTEMIDQLPVGIFIKRADNGQYVFWNRINEALYGISEEAVIGKTDREIFPASVADAIGCEDRDLLQHPGEVRKKVVTSRSDANCIIHSITATILDSGGRVQFILGISEDVSQENINLKMDLLFSFTRHEILDNLSVIMNHLERAQLKNTPLETQNFFEKTLGSITSIKNQISSMRALQDRGLIAPEWQPVRKVFSDAIALLPSHHADISMDLGEVEVFADPLLSRACYRLLDFSLRSGTAPVRHIRLCANVKGDTLHILFEDDGCGIMDDEKAALFDLDHPQGLYIIRELLGYTGISISAPGNAGRGCIFHIIVPKDKFRFPVS